MNGLNVMELKPPTLSDRLLKRKPKENLYRELNNYLASTPILQISRSVVENLLAEYKSDTFASRAGLVDLYTQLVRHFAGDMEINSAEDEQLRHIQNIFNLSSEDIKEVQNQVLAPLFEKEVTARLQDHYLAPEERTYLEGLLKSLRIPEETGKAIYAAHARQIVSGTIEAAISDRRLTPDEEAQLEAIAKNLGVSIQYDQHTEREMDRFRLLWRISEGELPILSTPILLQKSEVCYAVVGANHYEMRTVTHRYTTSGPRVSIRIMKGVRWTAASTRVHRHTSDEWKLLDSGYLYVTNRRLLFDGQKKSTSIQLKKIIDFNCYRDGLLIQKDTGKDQLFETSGDMELLGAILEATLEASRA